MTQATATDPPPVVTTADDPEALPRGFTFGAVRCGIKQGRPDLGIVVMSAIDNLWKGASSQAIQNLNLMLGLKETEGLR